MQVETLAYNLIVLTIACSRTTEKNSARFIHMVPGNIEFTYADIVI